jgi:hypothetical protein
LEKIFNPKNVKNLPSFPLSISSMKMTWQKRNWVPDEPATFSSNRQQLKLDPTTRLGVTSVSGTTIYGPKFPCEPSYFLFFFFKKRKNYIVNRRRSGLFEGLGWKEEGGGRAAAGSQLIWWRRLVRLARMISGWWVGAAGFSAGGGRIRKW